MCSLEHQLIRCTGSLLLSQEDLQKKEQSLLAGIAGAAFIINISTV